MNAKKMFAGMLVMVLALSVAQPVAAAPLAGTTITVTTTADDFRANGNCSLREAIQAANTNTRVDRCPAGSGTDTIRLGARAYRITRAGSVEDSNRTGDFDIRSSMVIVGAGMGKTFVDGGGLDRIFDGRSTAITVTVQDMTIQNGRTAEFVERDHGGALVNRGKMTLRRVEFTGNVTSPDEDEWGGEYSNGGAVWNKATMTITGSRFLGNTSGNAGGAVANSGTLAVDSTLFQENNGLFGGAIENAGTLTVKSSRFLRNGCFDGLGAAVHSSGTMTITSSRFEGNSDCEAGTLFGGIKTTVRYSTFKNNDARMGEVITAGEVSVAYSYFYNNSGTAIIGGGKVVVDKSTIQGGTGIAVTTAGAGRIANSTFSNIKTHEFQSGGLFEAQSHTEALVLESVTIKGTRVSEGEGAVMGLRGPVRLHNTIVTGTTSYDGTKAMLDCSGAAVVSLGYNLISRADGCMAVKTTGDKFGTLAAPRSAGLNPLAMNGGRTPTYALTSTSAARNAGDPALTVKTDQRGYIRPAGTRPDIGSYEYGAAAP